MFADILDFVCGYYEIESCGGEALLNYMLRRGVDFRRLRRDCDGALHFRLTHRGCRVLARSPYEFRSALRGLPGVLLRYKRRPGILAGAALFFCLLKLSTMFVWNIDVEGNENVPEERILALLEELGCSPGAYIPDIDFYGICNDFLERSDEVAWISVNLEGTSAHVEVREQQSLKKPQESAPANIVARADGYIRAVTVYNGMAMVKYDRQVRRGELLISGVIENKNGSTRLERAKGLVLAETEHVFDIEIPYEYTFRRPTGAVESRKTLKIFGKVIKLFQNSGISAADYDKIEFNSRVIIFGDIELPVTVTDCEYTEYENVTRRLTADEARERALDAFSARVAALDGAELLHSSVECEDSGDAYVLHCRLLTLEDIGETREISLDETDDLPLLQ